MANESVSHEQVKSICNSLECSPSKSDASGSYGGKAKTSVGGSAASSGSTSALHEGGGKRKKKD